MPNLLFDEEGKPTTLTVVVLAVIAFLAFAWFFWPKPAKAESVSPPIPGIAAVTNPASGSWTGVYVGVDGGLQLLDANATRSVSKGKKEQKDTGVEDDPATEVDESKVDVFTYEAAPISILNADNLGGKDWTYGVRAGFDWQVGNSPFVLGVLGGYGWGRIDSSMSFAEQTWASDITDIKGASFSIEPTWYVGGRVGLVLQSKSLMYVGAAWTQAEVDGTVTIAYQGGNLGFSGSDTVSGYMLLAGLETAIAPQWTLGAEYAYSRYEDVRFSGPHVEVYGNSVRQNHLDVEPDVHSVKVRLNFRPFSK
jgi:opacity protein-like surface antigen